MIKYNDLLNLDKTIAKELFLKCDYPWEVLPLIHDFILKIGPTLGDDYKEIKENVWVHKTCNIYDSSYIIGPAIIDEDTTLRHSAFIRENVIIGKSCIIGNSTEVKNSIIFDNSECPHFNYIGDAILGYHAHTGAGVILSNVKSDKTNITIKDDKIYETNLRKLSAILADNTEIGCNSVLCPGTIIGKNTNDYPLTRVRGVIGSNKIVKSMDKIVNKEIK